MSHLPNPDDVVLKLILVGDSGVGKSCLLKAFMGDPFRAVYTSTIGVDFEIKPLLLHNRTVNLQIWDTAGQERFRTITTSYYRSADAIMLVFDLTDERSLRAIETWMEDVRLYSQRGVECALIGNKCDLQDERRVDFKDAKAYADKNGFMYFEDQRKEQNQRRQGAHQLDGDGVRAEGGQQERTGWGWWGGWGWGGGSGWGWEGGVGR